MQSQNTIKRAIFEAALQCGRVWLSVVPAEGLKLPSTCQGECVDLEYRPDMLVKIGDEGVEAALSFGEIEANTYVPWNSVAKIYQGREGGFVAMFTVEVVLCRQKAVA